MKKVRLTKWVCVFLLMFMVFSNPSIVKADENTTVNEEVKSNGTFKYVETDSGIEIVEYLDMDWVVTIPSKIDEKPVIKIHDLCKTNYWNMGRITIPDTVIYIEKNALDGFSYVYANPNSYARKFADEHGITFECIEHANIVIDTAIPPTCGDAGKTEGSHCGDCNVVLEKQKLTPPTKNHIWGEGVFNAQDMTKSYTCTACGYTKIEAVKPLSISDRFNIGDDYYSVSIPAKSVSEKGGVIYTGTSSKKSTIIIPNTITVDGYTYKVGGIGKNVFKNNKKIKKVVIGNNVITINKNAFKGCKKLKNIIVKSKQIKNVGENAFKGIHPKAKIKVPSSKLKKYKKLFKNKGQKNTVKIVK